MNRFTRKVIYGKELYGGSKLKSGLYSIAVMTGIMSLTIIVTEVFSNMSVNTQSLMVLYPLAVLIISILTPTYTYGMIAAVISAFACDFFAADPRHGFSFTRSSTAITLLTLLAVSIVISTLTVQIKTQARLAIEKEKRIQLLYDINQRLIASRDIKDIVAVANQCLIQNLALSVIFYTGDPLSPETDKFLAIYNEESENIFDTAEEKKRAHRVFRRQSSGLDNLDDSPDGIIYFPVISKEHMLGVIGINCEYGALTQGKLSFVQMLTSQVALVLELQRLSGEQNRIAVDAEREKMRATLLRSISHDLRTPLTCIAGASSTILEQRDMDRDTLENLAGDIRENSKWLIRMVENILTVTKLTSDTMTLVKTPEAAEEVVSQTVSIVRARFPDCNIHVRMPNDLLMIPMDATLISQVLINLLENAVKNSPELSLILLDVKIAGSYARFDISDNGKGIPGHLLESLFEIHPLNSEQAVDSQRGMGIGLSICRTIIQAHGGTIEGYNKKDGGAKFSFLLPLDERDTNGE